MLWIHGVGFVMRYFEEAEKLRCFGTCSFLVVALFIFIPLGLHHLSFEEPYIVWRVTRPSLVAVQCQVHFTVILLPHVDKSSNSSALQ